MTETVSPGCAVAFGAGRSFRDHCLISSFLPQVRKPRLGEAACLPLGSLLALGVGTSSFGMFLPPGALLTQRGTVAESTASSYLFRAARKDSQGDVAGRRVEMRTRPQGGSTIYDVSFGIRSATCQLRVPTVLQCCY